MAALRFGSPRKEGRGMEEKRDAGREVVVRLRPATVALVLVGWATLVGSHFLARDVAAKNAAEQAEIEKVVREVNDTAAKIQKIHDETRMLLDPLTELLELDKRLQAAGIQPLGGREFMARLTKANRRLMASGLEQYIDTCAQKGEVEKHLLYEGLYGPIKALPGWSKDWQTACITILPSS